MPSRKLMTSVLRGFLGTYVSRNSDLDGHLVFGLACDSLHGLVVDLRDSPPSPSSDPAVELRRLAISRFRDQLAKVGLSLSVVNEGMLTVLRGQPRQVVLEVNLGQVVVDGHDYTFSTEVTTDLGRIYKEERHAFIAPFDAKLFRQSLRRGCS